MKVFKNSNKKEIITLACNKYPAITQSVYDDLKNINFEELEDGQAVILMTKTIIKHKRLIL